MEINSIGMIILMKILIFNSGDAFLKLELFNIYYLSRVTQKGSLAELWRNWEMSYFRN